MDLTAYAKSNPLETLEEHTDNLLKNFVALEKYYRDSIEKSAPSEIKTLIWDYLQKIVSYHDYGKITAHFQMKIRNANIKYIENKLKYNNSPNLINKKNKLYSEVKILKEYSANTLELPHNLLSPAFIYPIIKEWDDDIKTILIQSLIYHHYQSHLDDFIKNPNLIQLIKNIFNNDINKNYLSPNFQDIPKSLNYLNYLKKYIKPEFKNLYILLKGLLHRLDHSASAHLPVEIEKIDNPDEKLIYYFKKKLTFTGLKLFQQKAKDLREKSILLTASTGMGKTEFAINWIGNDKAFYTLPLRVSVNSMYERFKDIFTQDKIGLLHSDSSFYGLNYLEDKEITIDEEKLIIEEHIHRTNISRQFSMPITVTTADQLFTSVFKWKGYEKIYATLMYSKIVLDEPQSYSPEILAMIIKCLQEISKLGGKFCFMSATIYPFIKKYLSDYCEIFSPSDAINKEQKHKIKLEDGSIDNLIEDIQKAYLNGKKVLVIVNTVKKSQELFRLLKDSGNVKLLHSGFIQMHRRDKEDDIKKDDHQKGKQPVIWITTQIVEASLDIDYDILFTEIATLDALIQRMGRIFRTIGRSISENDEANIIVVSDEPSDKGYIYYTDIVEVTKEALYSKNGQILTEEDKQELMNDVYSDIDKFKNFSKKFKETYELLENGLADLDIIKKSANPFSNNS